MDAREREQLSRNSEPSDRQFLVAAGLGDGAGTGGADINVQSKRPTSPSGGAGPALLKVQDLTSRSVGVYSTELIDFLSLQRSNESTMYYF